LSGVYGPVPSAYKKPTNPSDGNLKGAPGHGAVRLVVNAARLAGSLNHADNVSLVGETVARRQDLQTNKASNTTRSGTRTINIWRLKRRKLL
jgi:hypothetical protein